MGYLYRWITAAAALAALSMVGGAEICLAEEQSVAAPAGELAPVTVKVPDALVNQGYTLETYDKTWALDKNTITVQPKLESTAVTLTDADGRIRAFDYVDLGADLFTRIYAHEWRFHASIGTTVINAQPARAILQNGTLGEADFDIDWQPTAFGLRLGLATQSSEERHYQIDSQYDVIALRAAATYERANLLGRLHALAYAGLFAANHHIELFDDVVSKSATANAFGPYGGIDLLYPLVNDIWLVLQFYMSYQRVEFKAFDFTHNFVERGTLIGASYGF